MPTWADDISWTWLIRSRRINHFMIHYYIDSVNNDSMFANITNSVTIYFQFRRQRSIWDNITADLTQSPPFISNHKKLLKYNLTFGNIMSEASDDRLTSIIWWHSSDTPHSFGSFSFCGKKLLMITSKIFFLFFWSSTWRHWHFIWKCARLGGGRLARGISKQCAS